MRRTALIPLFALVAALFALAASPADAATTISIDATFGDGGVSTTPMTGEGFHWGHAGDVDELGRTVVHYLDQGEPGPGYPGVVARFEPDGDLDAGFGQDGTVEVPVVAMSVAASSKGVAVANLVPNDPGEVVLVRLHEDGTLDERFADGGYLYASEAGLLGTSVVIDEAGALTAVIAQDTSGEGDWIGTLVRYREDGEPDTGFGGDGAIDSEELGLDEVGYLTYDGQGRLYALGSAPDSADNFVVRLTSAGALDPTYGRGGRSSVLAVSAYDLSISETDGSALVSGFDSESHEAVQRVTPAGSIDDRFGTDGLFMVPTENGRVEAVALPSGYVVVRESNRCLVLDRSGSLVAETTWDPEADRPFSFHSLWADPSGLVIAASMEGSAGTDDPGPVTVRRLIVDGPLLAPAVTSIDRFAGALSVHWAPPESVSEGYPVRAYHVIAVDGAGKLVSQSVVAGDVRQTSLEGVPNAKAVNVIVTGYDDVATIPASAPFAVAAASGSPPSPGPASAVPGVSATAGKGFATVSWQPSADDGGSTIWGYSVIAVRKSDGALAAWRNVRADARRAALPGLANGTTYDVHVLAVSSLGFGSVGTPVPVIPSAGGATATTPQVSWASVVPVGSDAVVTWGPPIERGEAASAVHVIVLESGQMKQWKAMTSFDRQVVVPAAPGAEVYVVAQSASGFGPLTGPITVD